MIELGAVLFVFGFVLTGVATIVAPEYTPASEEEVKLSRQGKWFSL